jgi:SAM-dependent methyltransferase
MTDPSPSDIVSDQYTRWPYPAPIEDLPGWLEANWEWFDPSHAHRLFWPDRAYRPDMDILVAGCGINQAAVFARNNPAARVVAIDTSARALAHHERLKQRYALANLELHRLPVEQAGSLERRFDLIVSTGVLHHLADPRHGLAALGACLKPDGVAALMVYARYGRIGVQTLQSVFRDLGFAQDEASLARVKDAIASLPDAHPVKAYLRIAPDLQSDAGWVDTFLHGREASYSIDDCLDLVDGAGLAFQDLFMKADYYPPPGSTNAFHDLVSTLPPPGQWSIMERMNFGNACHFFMACRDDRPVERYRIDFDAAAAMAYVPSFRLRCALDGGQICRPGWRMDLDAEAQDLVRQIDGRRTIGDIGGDLGGDSARRLFQRLWQLDFLAMGLPPD